MLSPIQIERLLQHCENIQEDHEAKNMCGDEGPEYFEYMRNTGWVEALRLVLETDTKSIKNTKLTNDS
jgi:hypothetical protein